MYILPILVCAILIAIDQIVKHLTVIYLKPIGSTDIMQGIFSLTYVENRGAAFGMMQGARVFFIVITVAVLIGIAIYYVKLPRYIAAPKVQRWSRVALVLIMAGALGNFIDRFLNGFVVDMFEATFIHFPVFNMADMYVVVGTILFATLVLFIDTNNKGRDA